MRACCGAVELTETPCRGSPIEPRGLSKTRQRRSCSEMTRRGEALALFDDGRVQAVAFSCIEIATAIVREEQREHAAGTDTVAEPLRVAAGMGDDAMQAG